jgi:hypothetical protein
MLFLAILCFASYAVLLFVLHDATFHTVDSVRDVVRAREIADGRAFPLVSQPWAAKYQTPPGYLYLLAIPFFFGGDERVAFLFVAGICFFSMGWLWYTLWHRSDRLIATAYAATAVVFPASTFLHSVGNAPLAFAASSLALACVIRVACGERGASLLLVLMLALMPQLHLSSVPIVLTVAIWLVWRFRTRMTKAAIFVAAILSAAFFTWLFRYGYLAAEYLDAQRVVDVNASSVVSRLVDWHQWRALATTYANYAKSIVAAPTWLVASVVATSGYLIVATIATFFCSMKKNASHASPAIAPVAAVTALSIVAFAAYLEGWGVWYFDSLLPWMSVSAAAGLTFLFRAARGSRLSPVLWFALLAGINIAPQAWLHTKLAANGFIEFGLSGLYASRHAAVHTDVVPVVSARMQLDRRDRLLDGAFCLDDVVGVAEWFLRDITLRDGYARCDQRAAAHSRAKMYTHLKTFAAMDPTEPTAVANPLEMRSLPPQRILINGVPRSSMFGDKLIRYGLYAPFEHATPFVIAVEPPIDTAQSLRIALRCFGVARADDIQWSIENADVKQMRIAVDRAMSAIRYMEFELKLLPSRENSTRISANNASRCDVSAYTL